MNFYWFIGFYSCYDSCGEPLSMAIEKAGIPFVVNVRQVLLRIAAPRDSCPMVSMSPARSIMLSRCSRYIHWLHTLVVSLINCRSFIIRHIFMYDSLYTHNFYLFLRFFLHTALYDFKTEMFKCLLEIGVYR